jgi:hypothetical protein
VELPGRDAYAFGVEDALPGIDGQVVGINEGPVYVEEDGVGGGTVVCLRSKRHLRGIPALGPADTNRLAPRVAGRTWARPRRRRSKASTVKPHFRAGSRDRRIVLPLGSFGAQTYGVKLDYAESDPVDHKRTTGQHAGESFQAWRQRRPGWPDGGRPGRPYRGPFALATGRVSVDAAAVILAAVLRAAGGAWLMHTHRKVCKAEVR